MAIEAFPDLTGYAPKSEAWHAYDTSTYCGCPDCHYPVGTGATADEAIADLIEQLEDEALAADPREQEEHERRVASLDMPEREP
jgi:hypothetical protein